jgi:hypothetical protein
VLQLLVVQNKRINLFIDEWIEKSMPPLLIKKSPISPSPLHGENEQRTNQNKPFKTEVMGDTSVEEKNIPIFKCINLFPLIYRDLY